jgi:hypothetical protein
MYGNFMENGLYHQLEDRNKLVSIVKDSIETFNSMNKKKIDIVLFDDAL